MSQLERIAEKLILATGVTLSLATLVQTFRSQTSVLQTLVTDLRAENHRLTSLVLAKDPMTYQALQATSLADYSTSDYVSQGTDEAEMAHWRNVARPPVAEDEPLYDDLRAMGLS